MTTLMRRRILAAALWGVEHTADIHYQQTRPMPLARYKSRLLPITTDCSGWVTCCYFRAGAPDPNGLGYTGQGFTGTLLDHLPIIPLHDAEAGDLIVYGTRPGTHVVVLLEDGTANGGNPWVGSHGQEAGPIRLRLRDESLAHHGEVVTALRGLVETPALPRRRWAVRGGAGDLIAHTHHPATWAARHPRTFHRHRTVTFHQEAIT